MAVFLCIDIGTSRVKTALIDDRGSMITERSRRLDRASSPDFQNAEEWYAITAELIRDLPASPKPDAISLTGNMHALLPIDKDGIPLMDAELWCSNRAASESDLLNRRYAGEFLKRFGNVSTPVFSLPKILKLKQDQPDLYRKTVAFLQVKDYIALRLTGELTAEPTDATGTLLCRLDTHEWDQDMITELGLKQTCFPEIRPSASICGKVTPAAAAETGLDTGLPVVAGAGDLSSAALGSGTGPGTLSLTLGTAGQLLAAGPRGSYPLLAGKLFAFAHADPTEDLYLGSVPGGGFTFEWLSKNMFHCTLDQFFSMADRAELQEDLPLFMPYLLGRGAPYMDYTPCAKWCRLSAHHNSDQLALGAVTGTLSALCQSAVLLEKLLNCRYQNVVLQSLAYRENAVRKTAAALFRQQKSLPVNPEASLLGAAVIAAVATGSADSFHDAQTKMVHTKRLPDVPEVLKETASRLFAAYMAEADIIAGQLKN